MSPAAPPSNAFSALLAGSFEALLFESRLPEKMSAWHGHVSFGHWIIAAARPRVVVELGTHYGVSFASFCHARAAADVDAKCYAVDTWRGDEHSGFYANDVYEGLQAFIGHYYGSFASLMRMSFDDARGTFADGSIDLLHIDGLHTYDAVKRDFMTWLPKMSSRGVVMFHDTEVRERDFGVWRLWEELRVRYPSFAFTHCHGLGVLCVGPDSAAGIGGLCSLEPHAADRIRRVFEQSSINAQFGPERRQRLAGQISAFSANLI